mgnify:CR=1 FL=1
MRGEFAVDLGSFERGGGERSRRFWGGGGRGRGDRVGG